MSRFKDLASVLNLTVVIAGLGYFVDLFDITLYGVVRVASLKELGLAAPADLLAAGTLVYNAQMVGLMAGGLLWGILADRRGRLSVLFGSILLYSLANLANVFVTSVPAYAACRFFGGLGLAGELGAAVTLVAESLPKERRGLGTTVVATLGMLGILAAALVGQLLPWRGAYALGGLMGLMLLAARLKMSESEIFSQARGTAPRGDFRLLLKAGRRGKYIACILVGVPIYFTTGVLWTFAPELTAGLGVVGDVSAGQAILFGSIGLTLGDFLSGLFSQALRSRKRAVALNLAAGLALAAVYTLIPGLTAGMIYGLCFLIGVTVGYWAVLVTMAAEQFGTNIRATAATTVPNFVRGSAVLAVSGFGALVRSGFSSAHAGLLVATVCFGLALLALLALEETFGRDLDYEDR